MGTIEINGRKCEFEGQKMILQVALENGIEIPHYCYHEGLSIVASCRICLAEVWAPNPRAGGRLEPIPKLLPTCQTPAGDGQRVLTESPKAIANQKAVMEYLILNHPLDCPVCDQAGECYLQDYSYYFGRGESRFEESKIKNAKKDLGPFVWLYADRCIMCSRCVRFTREVTGTSELCVTGRGAREEIDVFPGKALDNPLSGNVVDICPVGALLDKDFLFTQRVWLLKTTPSIDGVTASGDNIAVHHNDGRIYRVKPRKNMAVNKWWISDEIRYGWEFAHREDRLATPMRNQMGEMVESTWDSCYEEVNEELHKAVRSGGRVALLLSPMLSCEDALSALEYALAIDEEAIVGLGPVPVDGEDQVFPPGAGAEDWNAYRIWAEKAPNARGVRRVVRGVTGREALEFEAFVGGIKDAAGVIVTGNYPSEWVTKDLTKALAKKFVLLVDTLPNELSKKTSVVLPACCWLEKAGTFENGNGRLQAFEMAIAGPGVARNEGQIFAELKAVHEGRAPATAGRFNASAARMRLAEDYGLSEFVEDVHLPTLERQAEPDMAMVEL